jgi:hypothetical protein
MIRSRTLYVSSIRLIALLSLFSFLLIFGTGPAAASNFQLNWSQIGFENGNSALQTFPDIGGSGVVMTVEVLVLDSDFSMPALYVPGTTELNQGMPKTAGDASGSDLEVRDINELEHPNGAYIQTQITFSQEITIKDLWLEPFYHWTGGRILKHAALQAFDAEGNAVVPLSWQTYNGSSMIIELHPDPLNDQLWWRSDFPIGQNDYSGAQDIDFGDQGIKQLNWYSWGVDPTSGAFKHVLGSTLLGDFTFSVSPTAVTLVSLDASNRSVADATPVALALVLFTVATVGLSWRRRRLD